MMVRHPVRYAAAAGAVFLAYGLVQMSEPSAPRAQTLGDMKQPALGLQGGAAEKRTDTADVDSPAVILVANVLRMWSGEPVADVDPGAPRVELAGRAVESRSLAIPLLASPTRQLLVAGTRSLRVVWAGGKPPFKATLIGPEGTSIATWATADRSAATTLDLTEGLYELHVIDASAREVLGAFEVTDQAPTVDRSGIDGMPRDYGLAILGARLAAVDDGAWQMEAYERLVAAPAGDATRLTAARLARGLSVLALLSQDAAVR
jgi:hypothetical protein